MAVVIMVFISKGLGVKHSKGLVAIIDIGTASVEAAAIKGGVKRIGRTHSLVYRVEVSIRLLHRTELVAAVVPVHIKGCTKVVGDDFPFSSVESSAIYDDFVFHIPLFSFSITKVIQINDNSKCFVIN